MHHNDDAPAGLQHHSDYYVEQANQARAMAEQAADVEMQAILEQIATLYDALAATADLIFHAL